MRIVIDRSIAEMRGGLHELRPPWRWWRYRLRPGPDGVDYHQSWDAEVPSESTEYRWHFDLLHNYDIINPPSMFMTSYLPEFEDISGIWSDRRLLTRGPKTECDVVWYERPGDLWLALPGTTCRPGEFSFDTVSRGGRNLSPGMSDGVLFQDMPILNWPPVGVTTNLDRIQPALQRLLEAANLTAAFQVPPAMIGGPPERPRVEEWYELIMRARSDYMVQRARNPVAVIMNREDWEEMRRAALVDEDDALRRVLMSPGNPSPALNQYDHIFGLEVRAERSMPRGRMIVVGEDDLRTWNRGDGYRAVEPYMPPSILQDYLTRGSPTLPAPRRDVLPEDELVDEIDRLVNESLEVGPVDDYSVNRYPTCAHCPHQWHGTTCEARLCACLGELEDEV